MRVIGIDPGLKNTGFAIIEVYSKLNNRSLNRGKLVEFGGNYIDVLEFGVIKTNPKQTLEERLFKIFSEVSCLMKKYSPQKLILEKLYSHYAYPMTAILMGYARGVIMLSAGMAKADIIGLSATKVKKAVTGRGNASKDQVNRMIKNIFKGYNVSNVYDISDALALVLADISIKKLN